MHSRSRCYEYRTPAYELYRVIFGQYEHAYKNLHLSNLAQDMIFKFLSRGEKKNRWPNELYEWWSNKLRIPIISGSLLRVLKHYKNASIDTQQMAYFGKAKEKYTADRIFVHSYFCPKWVELSNLPKGMAVNELLHAIRMSYIPLVAEARTKRLVANELRKVPNADKETACAALYEERFTQA